MRPPPVQGLPSRAEDPRRAGRPPSSTSRTSSPSDATSCQPLRVGGSILRPSLSAARPEVRPLGEQEGCGPSSRLAAMEDAESRGLDLRDYVRILRRRAALIVTAVAVVLGAALASSLLQTPVYAAKAELLLQPRQTESLFDPN